MEVVEGGLDPAPPCTLLHRGEAIPCTVAVADGAGGAGRRRWQDVHRVLDRDDRGGGGGDAGQRRWQDVLGVIDWDDRGGGGCGGDADGGQRAEHAHHGATAVLHGAHLQHLDDVGLQLRLCLLPLGQWLAAVLQVILQIAVHLAHLVWKHMDYIQ